MNITQLSQGSLNGLRRQTSECLENAYRKGYEDGKNEPRKVKAVNVEDTSEYQIGYKEGRKDGFAYCRDNTELIPELQREEYTKGFEDGKKWAIDENAKDHQGYYNKGLEDGYKGYKYLNQWFTDNCFFEDEDNLFPEYKRRQADTCCLEDIITDVGFSEVLKRVKAYEEKKKPDSEIKVGDIVYYGEEMLKAVVLDIATEQGITFAIMLDENGVNVNEELSGLKFIEHTNEVEQLLNKLKGEKE